MRIIILDLVSPVKINNFKNYSNELFIPITPYSIYVCDYFKYKTINFHSFISQENFRNNIFKIMEQFKILLNNKECIGLSNFRILSQYLNYLYFISILKKELSNFRLKNYKIIYITDRVFSNNFLNNKYSILSKVFNFDKVKILKKEKFVKSNILIKLYYRFKVNLFIKILNKIKRKYFKYDWLYINPNAITIKYNDNLVYKNKQKIMKLLQLNFSVKNNIYSNIIKMLYSDREINIKYTNFSTFPSVDEFLALVFFRKIKKEVIMFQHGSYYYHYPYLKYKSFNLEIFEISIADINFVFNDYTKKLFEDLGAKKVYSVGSILFNQPIKERKKKYDFLYIIQAHDYSGNLQYVDFPNSLHSFDGYELYQRHKNIIKLFGTNFKDKKIVIRVHPLVVTTGVYVPFWELAENYPNITIDVSIPIHTLIEKSKYIISDYFSSEFINREIHYKRDIILFQGVPTPLSKETIKDMEKMFILVDTIDDLEDKVRNIETITKNRKRYDDIIEYYSSKKCDTKKLVLEILKKELNGTESKKEI